MATELTSFRAVPKGLRMIPYVDLMTAEQVFAAQATYRAFMINKPNPPEHAEYMARAAALYPKLPPGAQQNALHCLETLGKGYARRYVSNAQSRETGNQRHIMGMSLATYRAQQADELRPYVYQGVISDKRRKEYKAAAERYAAFMAPAKLAAARKAARDRKAAERRLSAELAAVSAAATTAHVGTTT